MKTCHLVWGAALALVVNTSAQAALDTTPDEITTLPAYCDAKMGKQTPASVDYWRAQIGAENWIHMHHYCGGLIELNRYYRSSTGRKKANLRNAVNEFSGMLNAWTPGFYLRPEAHLNRGKALKFMGRNGEALSDFLKALELNPKLASASVELADFYVKQGKKEQALAVLKKGLEQAPATKSLRRRYQELGGDVKALPVAAAPTGVDPATPVQTEASKPASGEPSRPAEPTSTEAAVVPPAGPLPEAKIGNKTNPWCRFCPDPAVSEPDPSKAN